jgi:putative endonuclease
MWFAYALRSERDGGLYIGMTCDVERRLKEHNSGYNRSTKSRAPLRLIYSEQCASRIEAREREKYLKSGKGREFLKSWNGMGGGNSTVESHSSKVMVAGSNPVPRSSLPGGAGSVGLREFEKADGPGKNTQ